MNGFLLAFSVVMNVLSCGILRNSFCKNDIKTQSDLYAFNAISSIVSALTLSLTSLMTNALSFPSLYTLLMGTAFGLITALCAIMNMKALECGPLSYTGIIVYCSMIIPAFSGLLFFDESVSLGQYVGTALMIVSFCCAVDSKNDTAGTSFKWFMLSVGAMAFNGGVGVMQKFHQNSAYKGELGAFLVTAFIVSTIFSFILMLVYKTDRQSITVLMPRQRKKTLIIAVISGVGFALCNQINLYLSGAMESIIFYPIVNGAAMLLTTAAGLILWKEHLTKKQQAGLIVGIISIFLLFGIFF